ncbi:ubiquitin domain-containing protein 2 isoform X1 [Chionomys nivalis]|uniref:ubiquitin domain-containing protein 2 isoform X1 n=1 Tax=Chionomys nivalis TaxID=269649 RepID=UPI002598DADD|nr:ubiquitin domain-containing protein 2 isoform X1 [Chionomys nivalis]
MGGCVGAQHDSSGSLNENSDGTGVALGRNQPLKKEKPKWKSDYPMTDGQLRSKRDEFWDTAPAFEGRKEIWDALKAAAHAFESNDHELAQAIIDGANITLPHGALTECYDELGNRYQLPVYCLAPPINMIEEKSDIETLDIPEPPPNSGHESQLRLRLSTGKDLKLVVRSTDTWDLKEQRGLFLFWVCIPIPPGSSGAWEFVSVASPPPSHAPNSHSLSSTIQHAGSRHPLEHQTIIWGWKLNLLCLFLGKLCLFSALEKTPTQDFQV